MKRASIAVMGLLLLSACSSAPHTASFGGMNAARGSDSCTALGFTPGSAQYDQCEQNQRIKEEVLARRALNGNKNQPDGVLAQTYGRPMGLMINCTSYQSNIPGSPSLCN